MILNKITVDDFNLMTDAGATEDDSFSEFVDRLDAVETNYFYVSLSPDDVIEAIENDLGVAEMLGVSLFNIQTVNIYIATY